MITSFYDWHCALDLKDKDPPFYACVIYLALKADTDNRVALERAWPGILAEVQKRHNAPAGAIAPEEVEDAERLFKDGKLTVLGRLKKPLRE